MYLLVFVSDRDCLTILTTFCTFTEVLSGIKADLILNQMWPNYRLLIRLNCCASRIETHFNERPLYCIAQYFYPSCTIVRLPLSY